MRLHCLEEEASFAIDTSKHAGTWEGLSISVPDPVLAEALIHMRQTSDDAQTAGGLTGMLAPALNELSSLQILESTLRSSRFWISRCCHH